MTTKFAQEKEAHLAEGGSTPRSSGRHAWMAAFRKWGAQSQLGQSDRTSAGRYTGARV